jgi:hypothetical protein
MLRFSFGSCLTLSLLGALSFAGCADEVKCGDKVVAGTE